MPAIKDILPKLEVRTSKRKNKCKRNNKHEIAKGDLWLIVTPRGPVPRDFGYCVPCGTAILEAAQQRLASCLSGLDPTMDAAPHARSSNIDTSNT
jgi:hypothetical protein